MLSCMRPQRSQTGPPPPGDPACQVLISDYVCDAHPGTAACVVRESVGDVDVRSVCWARSDGGEDETAARAAQRGDAVVWQRVDDDVELDGSRLCARRLAPGAYRVSFRRARPLREQHDRFGGGLGGGYGGAPSDEREFVAHFDVQRVALPTVEAYEGEHASSSSSRDGSVRAVVTRAPPGCAYLWSNGVTTSAPLLVHASSGVYAVVLVGAQGLPLPHLHLAAPFELRTKCP
jgi:hypothetical protein